MKTTTFIIHYECYDNNGTLIKSGITKVKNRTTKFEAQCDFEKYLKRKYTNYNRLVVNQCQEESPFGLNDLFNQFTDIFGSSFNIKNNEKICRIGYLNSR